MTETTFENYSFDPDNGLGEWSEPEGLFDSLDTSSLVAVAFALADRAASTVPTLNIGKATFVPSAAHSYARMLRAGMNETGYVNSFRTFEQQRVLYEAYKAGKGNLAAKPGTSRHEKGYATDISTGSAQQRWLTEGGTYNKVKSGEKLRANQFGWFRTVPSEPWHFEYLPAKDTKNKADDKTKKLQKAVGVMADGVFGVGTYNALKVWQAKNGLVADGIDGPKTWAVIDGPPVPPASEPEPDVNKFRSGTFNCGAFQKKSLPKKTTDGIVATIKEVNPSLMSLTECPEWLRDIIRAALPGGPDRWRVRPRGDQAVLFDSKKWVETAHDSMVFGPTSYHGAVWSDLKRIDSDKNVRFAVYHLPPNSVASDDFQKKNLKALVDKVGTESVVVAGDGADESNWVPKLTDAAKGDKTPTYGKVVRDRVHVGSKVAVRNYAVIDSKGSSDHNAVLANLTLI